MSKGLGEICVYVAVDVSGSMAGSKCEEMCQTLRSLNEESPDDVLFDFTLFHTFAVKGVTGYKAGINVDLFLNNIRAEVGKNGTTALYDT